MPTMIPNLSAEASDRVQQLTTLTERLTALLAAEAQAFEARRPLDVAAGADETARLANLYRHESTRIKADPSLIAGAPALARSRLVTATQTFEAVLARHGRALTAAKTVTEGLVQALAQEIADTRTARAPYGSNARSGVGEAAAIALNRKA